jgi:N-methylhydantoinase B
MPAVPTPVRGWSNRASQSTNEKAYDEPFTVRLTLCKRDDEIVADFAGSDGPVVGPMNAPLTVTASGVYCALNMIADPQSLIPPNSGCWRPVRVTAPPGSVVNAQPPAPIVYANHEISHRAADMVMRRCSGSAQKR